MHAPAWGRLIGCSDWLEEEEKAKISRLNEWMERCAIPETSNKGGKATEWRTGWSPFQNTDAVSAESQPLGTYGGWFQGTVSADETLVKTPIGTKDQRTGKPEKEKQDKRRTRKAETEVSCTSWGLLVQGFGKESEKGLCENGGKCFREGEGRYTKAAGGTSLWWYYVFLWLGKERSVQ